ncbi:MAG: hypothetical protein ABR507_05000 [Actinomycetota bacterium]|nr:hypothetical protein [Actinomycetota bacterium]
MTATKEIFYAAVGASDLAIEKARRAQLAIDLPKLNAVNLDLVRSQVGKAGVRTTKAYSRLVERGQKTVSGIKNSAYTKRAIDQTKTARTQTKSAVTSARKAAAVTLDAGKKAASSL